MVCVHSFVVIDDVLNLGIGDVTLRISTNASSSL
jgi:hypothetical protein